MQYRLFEPVITRSQVAKVSPLLWTIIESGLSTMYLTFTSPERFLRRF